MADIINKQTILKDFLAVINSNLTTTLDIVLQNGIFKANNIVVLKGTRELNAPSDATATEKDRILSDGSNTRKSQRATVQNTCEIIDKFVSLSDSETALEKNRLATEIEDAILEIKQDMNRHIWLGTLSNNDPRRMANVLAGTPASHKITKTKAEITKDMIIAGVNTAKKYSTVNTVFGGYDAIQFIAGLLKASETRVQNDGTISLDITKLTIAGQTIDVVFDETLADSVVFGNRRMLELYTLNPLRQIALSKTGRTTDYMVDIEYTVLNRNPKAFYQIKVSDLHE
jgi:hypothetical protein